MYIVCDTLYNELHRFDVNVIARYVADNGLLFSIAQKTVIT